MSTLTDTARANPTPPVLDEARNARLPEPFRTAQDYIDWCGIHAEFHVGRLASELAAAGEHETVAKLAEVLEAIQLLRRTERHDDDATH